MDNVIAQGGFEEQVVHTLHTGSFEKIKRIVSMKQVSIMFERTY